jgi:6-phosphogluconate dehydrogenase
MQAYSFGIVGLGVMGHNLALNIERNGFSVLGFDLDTAKAQAFLAGPAAGKRIALADSFAALTQGLEKPRRILFMVPAGPPVDKVIASLRPGLETGDVLIDGGNSFFLDTEKRSTELAESGLHFVGMGVSGGEEGALWGPALMPGGTPESWQALRPILEAIAAKAEDGLPCVTHIGPRGAGHYVKMVHNGIEYADMELIAEIYDLLHRGAGLDGSELGDMFDEWNQGELHSYLVEISAGIFRKMDSLSNLPLLDQILDEAEMKGTGEWTSQNAFDLGAPIPTINAAVESRLLSSLKAQRQQAAAQLQGPAPLQPGQKRVDPQLLDDARQALYASKITAYAQGMSMLERASATYDYGLNLAEITRIWRAGCIIRAALLNDISDAFKRSPQLPNLLLDPNFGGAVASRQAALRRVVSKGVEMGIPVLGLSSALAHFDAYRSPRLPANLIQAQRYFFGAHTYRRIDREGIFHTEWETDPKEASS